MHRAIRVMSSATGVSRRARRGAGGAALAVLVLAVVSACHDGSSAAAPAPVSGGTLNVYLSTRTIVSLDPQGVVYANDANVSRLIDRTLTTTTPSGALVPDLATDTGHPSHDNSVWEFALKPNLKWSDGSPLTCADIKYGIERRYTSTVAALGGLSYPMDYLKNNAAPYEGPYNGTELDSITCKDTRKVQFELQRPVGDFGYTVSVSTFAPVKRGADRTRPAGDLAHSFVYDPISDGPYKVDPAQTVIGKVNGSDAPTKLVLVRNNFWNPATDNVRKAYPDRIAISFDANGPAVTNNLINTAGDYRNGIGLDTDVAPNFVQQVINDPDLAARTVAGAAGATRYFALNMNRLTTRACRQALEYGFDKRAFRFVLGGAVAGDLATSMIPPTLASHADFDLYGTKAFPDGDTAQAKKLLAAGECPTTVSLAFPDTPLIHLEADSISNAYARIGVGITQMPLNTNTYNQLVANPKNTYDMIYSGWVPDWPNGSAIIPPLFDGVQTKGPAAANLDFSELNDPEINSLIQQAYAEPDLQTQYHLWGQLDHKIMDEAAVIPVLYTDVLRLYGSNVRGVQISAGYGEPDLATIGLGPSSSAG